MKFLIIFILALNTVLGDLINSYIDHEGNAIDHYISNQVLNDANNNLYRVIYDAKILGSNLIVNLDKANGIKNIYCDISNIEFTIVFANNDYATSFAKVMNTQSRTKFITGMKWNCSSIDSSSKVLMRRVFNATASNNIVNLDTAQGYYEETMLSLSLSIEKKKDQNDFPLCLGANSNDCIKSKKPLPIYKNKHISVQCQDCYIGMKTTMEIRLNISKVLKHIDLSLKDIEINSGFVMNHTSDGNRGAGKEYNYMAKEPTVIMNFWIGPVPVSIWYEIPLAISGGSESDVKSHVVTGVKGKWNLGTVTATWTASENWNLIKDTPTFKWIPSISGSGEFFNRNDIMIAPSFIVHFMRMVDLNVTMVPALKFETEGNIEKKETCATAIMNLEAFATVTLHVNIPLRQCPYDRKFGPVLLFKQKDSQIGHWCKKQ